MMRGIRAKDTKPERIVRSLLHRMGYRFRLHRKDLPGSPDIVLPRHRTVIFVHGCFWHRHLGCRLSYDPKSNRQFWKEKFRKNVERDARMRRSLDKLGWQTMTVWECETGRQETVARRLRRKLG